MPRYKYVVREPTVEYVRSRLKKFENDRRFYGVEDSLRLMFDTWSTNRRLDHVLAKASCLDRLYSTNVYAIVAMADHIVELDVDAAFDAGDPEVVERIATLKLGKSKRRHYSFATKYCSFSRPDTYHIFDNQVHWLLLQYRKLFKFATFEADGLFTYRTFAQVLEQFANAYGLTNVKKKELDKFLWIEASEIKRLARPKES